jgi:hypothetical protein
MNIKKRIVILSAELKELTSLQNEYRTSSLKNALETKGYNFVQALGTYKGSLEKSFVVDASEDVLKPLQALAGFFRQESILVVNEDQKAILMYSNGQNEKLGQMTQVNSITGLDSWTLVNGLFYTVK